MKIKMSVLIAVVSSFLAAGDSSQIGESSTAFAQAPPAAKQTQRTRRQPPRSVPGIEISEESSPITRVKVTAEDGNQIEVVIRMPPGDGPFPAIVLLHGGMSHQRVDFVFSKAAKEH